MARRAPSPALVAHGGAGAVARLPPSERAERKRAILEAVRRGADILKDGGSSLDAVVATVIALEDHPLYNAGTGSLLTTDGTIEMDAALMVANAADENNLAVNRLGEPLSAGAVGAVGRVRNPILLARAVMENTRHLLLIGQGAERLARRAGVPMCANEDLITDRARTRWRDLQESVRLGIAGAQSGHGTVGAVAIDARGSIATSTSTGGVPGKISGRVGDSAIIGAGTFANHLGGASATGYGEAIILTGLCREAVGLLENLPAHTAARRAIVELLGATGSDGGIIMVDRYGRIGFAHNVAMEVATYDARAGLSHHWPDPVAATARAARSTRHK